MASLAFQNFIFFLTRFSSNVVFIFQKSLNVWKYICLEAICLEGPIEKEMCHLKAEKNKVYNSGCLLSQILFHCFVCLCYMYFLFILLPPLWPYYVCSNPIMIIFSVDEHHLAFL